MQNKGKIPSIVLVVLVLISLSLAGGAFYLLQKEKARSTDLEAQLEDLRTKERIIETKLEDSKKTISKLEEQLRESKSNLEFLSAELAKEKKASQDTLTELQQQRIELEEQKKAAAESQQKLNQTQEQLKNLQAQLKALEEKKAELENKIKKMEEAKSQKVELGTIVVGQQESVAPLVSTPADTKLETATALEGKILVINKDYNFAVINLGNKDGVNINDIFSIYHKNKYIGDIKIEKVHDSMSAANFLSPDLKENVREGDKVVLKTK